MKVWNGMWKALTRAAAVVVIGAGVAEAQVTSGGVTGRVTDSAGTPVANATVQVRNTESGFSVTATSRANGQYIVSGLEPGGAYDVTARAIGYRPAGSRGVRVPLGGAATVNLTLIATTVQLEEIVTTADPNGDIFNTSRNGTATIVTDSAFTRQPTLNRELTDFIKLSPQVAVRDGGNGGISALGQNNRFNTVQVDGATVNDRFGLGSTGFAGGQAEGRAVALEAVKELQVLIAPYDVRQGNFSGALINAVTKSGTNDLRISGFYTLRNEGLAGDPLSQTEFKNQQFGGSIGGPIVKDKAHFFVAGELRRRTSPANGPYLGQPAELGPTVFSGADLEAVRAAGASRYGLTPEQLGNFDLINNRVPAANLTARVDVKVGENNRLAFRYGYNYSTNDVFSRANSGTVNLSSQGYFFESRNNNPSLQFFSNFKNGSSNELLVSYNRIRDARTPNAFLPQVVIQNFPAASGTGAYSVRFGAEQFSQGNELDQDIFELTDNFSFNVGTKHRLTVGTRNEFYKVRNLFAQSSFGVYTFDDIEDFQNGVVEQYSVSGPLSENFPVNFRSGQLGFYVQDNFTASPNLTLTAGVRADLPFWVDQPVYAPEVIADFGPQEIPSGNILLAPRLGFNWDARGNGLTQVRGGAGLFAGTPAYVWFSNSFQQSGTGLGQLSCGVGSANPAPAAPATFDAANPIRSCGTASIAPGATLGEVNLTSNSTRFPRVFRTNLAIDQRLPGNAVLTVEGTYSKSVNELFIVNRNLNASTGTDANGRALYGTLNGNGTVSPSYFNLARYGPSFSGGVYELRNTSAGRVYSATVQLQKSFGNGLNASASYTYSDAKDVQSFTSSRAISNWRFGRVTSGLDTDDQAFTSDFNRPNRVVLNGSYTFPWKRFPTDISLTYIGQSGTPYTLVAGGGGGRGDLNRDGTNSNDPIYIPTDATDPSQITFVASGSVTAAQQAATFEQYIASEPCLNSQRGQIMERNSCRNPWQNFLDLTVRQSLPAVSGNKLTLELGIFNLLNLLDSESGVVKTIGGGTFSNPTGLFVPNSGGVVNGTEAFQLGNVISTEERFVPTNFVGNSYQIQLGVRYSY